MASSAHLFAGAAALAALLGAGVYWLAPSESAQAPVARTAAPTSAPASAPASALPDAQQIQAAQRAQGFVTGLERLPASLQGTSVDGEILIDEQKNLHVSRGLRQLFDYFLSTVGEESLPTVVARVEAYLRNHTPQPAQNQVIDLFHRYLQVLDDLRHVKQAGGSTQLDLDAVTRQKAEVNQIRHRHLSNEEIKAFYGEEDALDDYTLASLRIQQNPQLSATEKARQLADLAQQQPASLSAQQKTLQQYQQLETLTAELRARNASPQELQAMRTQLVGAEAASRLEALDQETASWNQRVSQYLSARQQILQQNASNPAAQTQQIEALRQQMGFDAEAQKRLPTFEAHPELLKP